MYPLAFLSKGFASRETLHNDAFSSTMIKCHMRDITSFSRERVARTGEGMQLMIPRVIYHASKGTSTGQRSAASEGANSKWY
jgi:hypothetical protein